METGGGGKVSGKEWERLEHRERLEHWEAGIARNLRLNRRARISTYVALVLTLLILGVTTFYGVVRYNALVSDVREACAGRIAALDLTDWIAVCKETG